MAGCPAGWAPSLGRAGRAFGTEPAFINWKVVARLNPDHMVLLNQKIHAALYAAIRAMSRHDFVDDPIRAPAAIGRVMKVGPIGLNDLIEIFYFTHTEILAADECGSTQITKSY